MVGKRYDCPAETQKPLPNAGSLKNDYSRQKPKKEYTKKTSREGDYSIYYDNIIL
jgi:hypothetical protein